MILRERDYIANRRNERGSEDKVAQVDGPIFDEGDLADAGGQGQQGQGGQGQAQGLPGQGNGQGNEPVGAGEERQGDYSGSATVAATAPPADIPSGDDDDVVARQIREAALREKDPVLREKLWDEYRKYKNQAAKESS